MEHLTRFASSLQSSVSSTVFSTVSAVNSVLPGNPVTREFEATEHVASAGPGTRSADGCGSEGFSVMGHSCLSCSDY